MGVAQSLAHSRYSMHSSRFEAHAGVWPDWVRKKREGDERGGRRKKKKEFGVNRLWESKFLLYVILKIHLYLFLFGHF